MVVEEVNSLTQFKQILKDNDKVIVDFSATWCGPCKTISPKFKAHADKYTDIKFIKVDVDDGEELAAEYKVSAMPTFKCFLKGEPQEDLNVVGANEKTLIESLDKLQAL